MDAVVGHLAAAVVPVPMPVVRDEVVLIRPLRSWPLPKVVIEMFGNGCWFALADCATAAGVKRARREYLTNDSLAQLLHRLHHHRVASALVTHLHVALVLACCRYHEFGLGGVMAARFFNVDMLAGLAAKDGGRGMPKIGCSNCDGVKVGILQHQPQIGDTSTRSGLFFCHCGERVGRAVVVHVTYIGNLDIGNLEEIVDVRHAATETHHANAKGVVGLVCGMNRVTLV